VAGIMGAGSCTVCGHVGEYVRTEAPTRENHECAACRASLRYRQQAATSTATYATPSQQDLQASMAERAR
jgi:hypothetical protein